MSEIVGYGSNNYSLDEQIIGKWVDGKSIYQKCFMLSSPVDMSNQRTWYTLVNVASLNIESLVDCKLYSGSGGDAVKNIWSGYYAVTENGSLKAYCIAGSWNCSGIVLQYTKTTDTV